MLVPRAAGPRAPGFNGDQARDRTAGWLLVLSRPTAAASYVRSRLASAAPNRDLRRCSSGGGDREGVAVGVAEGEHCWDSSPPQDLICVDAAGLKLGVSRFVISRVLNHADPTVTGVYDRYEYLREKRQALEAWAAALQRVVTDPHADIGLPDDTNVVPLPQRA